jgi:hypothetical protein
MLKNHNKVKMPWGFGLDGKQSMNTKKIARLRLAAIAI